MSLADVLAWVRPEWHARAACRGVGPERFYPEGRGSVPAPEARALCAACPVRPECAAAGEAEPAGVWGGVRRSKARRRQPAA